MYIVYTYMSVWLLHDAGLRPWHGVDDQTAQHQERPCLPESAWRTQICRCGTRRVDRANCMLNGMVTVKDFGLSCASGASHERLSFLDCSTELTHDRIEVCFSSVAHVWLKKLPSLVSQKGLPGRPNPNPANCGPGCSSLDVVSIVRS